MHAISGEVHKAIWRRARLNVQKGHAKVNMNLADFFSGESCSLYSYNMIQANTEEL